MIAADAEFAAGVHERCRAEDVGLQKDAGIFDGAVDMAFRREIDDDIGPFLLKETEDALSVADIQPDKAEVALFQDARKRRKIACIGELIEADDAVVGILFQHVEDEVAADEAGTARDEDGHWCSPLFLCAFLSGRLGSGKTRRTIDCVPGSSFYT